MIFPDSVSIQSLPIVFDFPLVVQLAYLDDFRVGHWVNESRSSLQNELCGQIFPILSVIRASNAFIRELIEAQALYFQHYSLIA